MSPPTLSRPTVKVPANVELEDRLAFGLTGKQLLILAATAVVAYAANLALTPILPTPFALAATFIVAAGGVVLAVVRVDGLGGDQLALAIARFALAPRRRVLAPEGLPAPPPGSPPGTRVLPLDLPLTRILRSGLVELSDGSHCRLLTAQGTSFELRAAGEQAAFLAAFGRFLNGLQHPVQILVRSEPVTLDAHADRLDQTTRMLEGRLQAAAADHATYLRALSAGPTPPRRRQIIVVLRTHPAAGFPEIALERAAAQAAEILAGAEVELRPLNGHETAALLARSLNPGRPVAGAHLEGVIRGTPRD